MALGEDRLTGEEGHENQMYEAKGHCLKKRWAPWPDFNPPPVELET